MLDRANTNARMLNVSEDSFKKDNPNWTAMEDISMQNTGAYRVKAKKTLTFLKFYNNNKKCKKIKRLKLVLLLLFLLLQVFGRVLWSDLLQIRA